MEHNLTMNDRYNYAELRAKAVAPGATQADINTLGEWFFQFGSDWNGEYYDADGGKRLYPIYKQIDEDDFETIGYEFG